MRVYCGNLPYSMNEAQVREVFSVKGFTPTQVKMVMDRESGGFRGFCFVDFEDDITSEVIETFHGADVGGRHLIVNLARPKDSASREPYSRTPPSSYEGSAPPASEESSKGPGRNRNGGRRRREENEEDY